MLIRVQGFDKGVFGGNFHTHNCAPLAPGLDVVCYSDGASYVRGMRFSLRQARGGRVVLSLDSTDLLNKRDSRSLHSYPAAGEELSFDDIIVHRSDDDIDNKDDHHLFKKVEVVVVTYGNGVSAGLIAAKELGLRGVAVTVVECPYLSRPPSQLEDFVRGMGGVGCVLFADVCKEGSGMPLAGIALSLHNSGYLSNMQWKVIGACPTYNPLGNTITFLNSSDIIRSIEKLIT
jgi:hypothetical protein